MSSDSGEAVSSVQSVTDTSDMVVRRSRSASRCSSESRSAWRRLSSLSSMTIWSSVVALTMSARTPAMLSFAGSIRAWVSVYVSVTSTDWDERYDTVPSFADDRSVSTASSLSAGTLSVSRASLRPTGGRGASSETPDPPFGLPYVPVGSEAVTMLSDRTWPPAATAMARTWALALEMLVTLTPSHAVRASLAPTDVTALPDLPFAVVPSRANPSAASGVAGATAPASEPSPGDSSNDPPLAGIRLPGEAGEGARSALRPKGMETARTNRTRPRASQVRPCLVSLVPSRPSVTMVNSFIGWHGARREGALYP